MATAPSATQEPTHLEEPITLTSDRSARVTTDLTDYGAFLVLETITGDSYAADLAHIFSRFGSWSHNRRVWAHIKAQDAIARGRNPLPAHLVANARDLNARGAASPVAPPPAVALPAPTPVTRRERTLSNLSALLGTEEERSEETPVSPVRAPSAAIVEAPAPAAATPQPFGLPIIHLIERAQQGGAKRIKFRLQTADGRPVVLKPASENANPRNQGCVYVNDGGSFDNQVYYGKFEPNGLFFAARACTPEIAQLLADFATDPARVAAEYGRATSNCCFCAKTLRDARSTTAGYGPDCAQKYGLPWGE